MVAGHRQDAKEFGNGTAGTGDFPFADRVGPTGRRKATELRHVGSGQRFADGVSEMLAKLFQFRAGHGSLLSLPCAQCVSLRARSMPIRA